MTFDEFLTAVDTLAPSSVKKTNFYADILWANYEFKDLTGDTLTIEISLKSSAGQEILISEKSGDSWFFALEFCQWLGMVSGLIADVKGGM